MDPKEIKAEITGAAVRRARELKVQRNHLKADLHQSAEDIGVMCGVLDALVARGVQLTDEELHKLYGVWEHPKFIKDDNDGTEDREKDGVELDTGAGKTPGQK